MAAIQCRLEFTYPDPKTAAKVLHSVEQENPPFIHAHLRDEVLVSEAEAESLDSLVHTLEDYLACVSVAERMLGEG